MNVKTQSGSRRYSRRVPMRVVIEILNGCVYRLAADGPCEVLVIDRDELAEVVLPDGEPGYAGIYDVPIEPKSVDEDFQAVAEMRSD